MTNVILSSNCREALSTTASKGFCGRRFYRSTLRMLVLSGIVTFHGFGYCAGYGNDNQGCDVSAPCFRTAYQSGNNIVFVFDEVTGWDFYNVRHLMPGGREVQVENRSGTYTLRNVRPNSRYYLKVQGCHSHFAARSSCSDWVTQWYDTK